MIRAKVAVHGSWMQFPGDKRDAGAAVDDDVACRQPFVVGKIVGLGADGLGGHLGGIGALRRRDGRQKVAGAEPERRSDESLRHRL